MKRPSSHLGIALRLVVVTVVALVVSFQSPPAARAQDSNPADALELNGAGSFEVVSLINAWSSSMFDSSKPVNVSYVPGGDTSGRTKLATGQADFAISGRPLSDDNKAALAARNVDVISAPLALMAAAFVYEAPADGIGLAYTTPDPVDPLEGPVTRTNLSNIHLTPSVLARSLTGEQGYNMYLDPDFLAQLEVPNGSTFFTPQNIQQSIARGDPGAFNYYLEQFILKYGADRYNLHLAQQLLPPNALSEDWPFLDMPGKVGSDGVKDVLVGGQSPQGGGSATGGAIGAVDPLTALNIVNAQAAKRDGADLLAGATGRLSILPMLNGAGEWVLPTPASITAAGKAGNGTPLYGFSESSPGAYPFTWTVNLMVPSTGLPVDTTNALATFLRYASGPGQSAAAGVAQGALPDSLRAEAADRADDIVKGNCKAAGGTTKTDKSGGPYWPPGVDVPSGGTLLCVAPDGPATTTTAGSGGTSNSGGSGGSSGSSSGSGGTSNASGRGGSGSSGSYASGSSSDPGTADEGSGAGGPSGAGPESDGSTAGGVLAARTVKAELPLKPPDDGQFALDRFATIMLGGVFFLILRSIVRPRLVGPT